MGYVPDESEDIPLLPEKECKGRKENINDQKEDNTEFFDGKNARIIEEKIEGRTQNS